MTQRAGARTAPDAGFGRTLRARMLPQSAGGMLALLALLGIDLLLLAGNLLFLLHDEPGREPTHPVFSGQAWNGDNDRSYIEVAGAFQLGAAIVLLLALSLRRRSAVFAAWALAFTWVVADDLLTLHEHWGSALVTAWRLPATFGYDPQYLGETLVWVLVAPVLVVLLAVTHRRADATARKDSKILLAAAAILVLFAVGIDTLATLAGAAHPALRTGVVLTETAGELFAMTLVLTCALSMMRSGSSAEAYRT